MVFSWRTAALLFLGSVATVAGCKGDRGPTGTAGPSAQSALVQQGQNLGTALTAARVTGDNHLQVDYALTDAAGNTVTMDGVTTYWTAAYLGTDVESGLPAWQSIVLLPAQGAQPETPTYESNTAGNIHGTTDELGAGKYRYTFTTALPEGAARNATFRIGSFMRRPLPGVANPAEAPDYDIANAVLDFVPAGGAPQPRDLVATQSCNTCHGILQAHGGYRRDVRLCTTCHTTQLVNAATVDTGTGNKPNPLDLGRMVHRIHRGEHLPTVEEAAKANDLTWKYQVISRFGTSVYAEPIANPNPATAATTKTIPAGVRFPQDLRNCAVCHSPGKDAAGNVVAGAQADQWKAAVSRRTCTSCHDSSWFNDNSPPKYHVLHQQASNPVIAAGTNPTTPAYTTPAGLVQTDDGQCKTCHSQTLMEQHHTAPTLSAAFNPLTLKINSAKASGGTLAVNFTITNKDGSPVTDLTKLSSASATASGPTTDYQVPSTFATTANLITTATPAATPGTYDVSVALPSGATGSWAVGLEARRVNPTLTASERKLGNLGTTATAYDFAPVNPVAYFDAAGGASATPRRVVVAQESCNACHQILSLHGSLRHTPQYCVLCHAPNATDHPGAGGAAGGAGTGRPPGTVGGVADVGATVDKLAERSIHLKAMVHQIHTGEELQVTTPFVIYGFGRSVNFMGEARFPGTRARCDICHVPRGTTKTFTVDAIPANAQPTKSMQWTAATKDASGAVTSGGTTVDVRPITSACISCHDSPSAHAHAQQNTLNFGTPQAAESCAVCHSETADFAVTRAHQKFAR